LLAPIIGSSGLPIGLSSTSQAAASAWFAGAPLHESMIEGADFDAQLCGDGTTPIDAPLSRIHVPVFYIGAAGGTGEDGIAATTQVSSSDVTTLVVSVTDDVLTDYGHGDLLYAEDAAALVWQPLATWLASH
jgi:hypothetical protein